MEEGVLLPANSSLFHLSKSKFHLFPSISDNQPILQYPTMDFKDLAKKLGLPETKYLIRKAAELRRLCDVQFDSSIIGVGEICKAIICLEIAANRLQVLFDRHAAIKLSGMSEKAYTRSFNSLQNGIGVKNTLDIRELGIRFGCVRLIPFVKKSISVYRERFIASLPASRRATADFTRPVFTAVAFYLCAKRHKLKVDKLKLIEVCGTSESEFSCVANSLKDLCHDALGISKEKKDPKEVRGNRGLLDALPEARTFEDGGILSDDDGPESSCYKKRKRMEKQEYDQWKSTVLSSKDQTKPPGSCKRTKQTKISFLKKVGETKELELEAT